MTFFQPLYSDDINKRLLHQLYLHAKKSLISLLVLSFVLAYFLHDIAPGYLVYSWLVAASGIALNRLRDSYYYLSHDCSDEYKLWYRKLACKVVITAVLWGAVPILFMPYGNDAAIQLFISLLILGLSGGAAGSLGADRRIALTYMLILLLPFGLYLFFSLKGEIGIVLFFTVLLYIATLYNSAKHTSNTLLESYQNEEELIGAKNELFIKQDELNNLFQQTPIGVFYCDLDYKIIDCNTALSKIMRSSPEELIGIDLRELPDQRPIEVFHKVLDTRSTEIYHGSYRSIKGLELWIEVKCSPLVNSDGQMTGVVALLEDKTNEKAAIDELKYMTRHDDLTGLLNRRGFEQAMNELVSGDKHADNYSLLFYLDLNQFKGINDSLGHKVGDEVLTIVAQRLRYALHDDTMMGRFGGDEFVISIPYVSLSKEEAKREAQTCLILIKSIFSDPYVIDDLHLYVQASIGVIIIEPNYKNIHEMIRHADMTMYQAKSTHQNISFYDEKLDQAQKELFVLQHDLAYAPENNQLEIFYQPIVAIRDNRIISAEALIRWQHPQKGLMSPGEFIPLALKAGLIHEITWWIVEHICQQIKAWKDEGVWDLRYISININAQQLVEQNFANVFLSTLDKYGVATEEVSIEITEQSLIDNFESAQTIISQLQQSGIRCAIDDFGTGYSSLSYLQKLSFHTLKIDREFIREIEHKPNELSLVRSILEIGRTFNYNIIIEGIEHDKQKEILLEMDDNLSYQGFLFSRPIDSESFKEKFLSNN